MNSFQELKNKQALYNFRKQASIPACVSNLAVVVFIEKNGGLKERSFEAADNLAEKAKRFFGKVKALKGNPNQGAGFLENVAYRAGQGTGVVETGAKKLVKDPDARDLAKIGLITSLKQGPGAVGGVFERLIPHQGRLSNKADKLDLGLVKHPDNVHVLSNQNIGGADNAGAGFTTDLEKLSPHFKNPHIYTAFTGSKSKGESLLHELGHIRDFQQTGGKNMEEFYNKSKARQGGFVRRLFDPKASATYKNEQAAWDHAHDIAKEQNLTINPDSQKHALNTYMYGGVAKRLGAAQLAAYPVGVHLRNKWFPETLSAGERQAVDFVSNPRQTVKTSVAQAKEYIKNKNPFNRNKS